MTGVNDLSSAGVQKSNGANKMKSVKCVCLALVIACVISGFPVLHAQGDSLEKLISANESHQAGIRSFDVHIDVYAPKQPQSAAELLKWATGGTGKSVLFFKCRWSKSGAKERFNFKPLVQIELHGQPQRFLDVLISDGNEYVLENWNEDARQTISPAMQGALRAQVRLHKNEFVNLDPSMFLLVNPRVDITEPRLGTREYIARFKTVAVTKNTPELAVIRLTGDSRGIVKNNEHVELELSKAHGFSISRLEKKKNSSPSAKEFGVEVQSMQHRVVKFVPCGDGLYFPLETEYSIVDASTKKPVLLGRCLVEIASLNETIPGERFELVFPKDAIVHDQVAVPGEDHWMLWGADNKPVKEVKSKAELIAMDPNYKPPGTPTGSNWNALSVLASALVAIVIVGVGARWLLGIREQRK